MPKDFAAPENTGRPASNRPSQHNTPLKLTLAFSRAADYSRINRLFNPAIKQKIDPLDYVAKRKEPDFRQAIQDGSAGFLSRPNGDITTLTVAYRTHISDTPSPGSQHDYTEFGTGLSAIPGYKSAQLVMGALALKEWWNHPPRRRLVNEIENTNGPSVRTYRDHLGWEEITDKKEISTLFNACYKNVADDYGNGPAQPPPPEKRKNKSFYGMSNKALATHARILLEFIKQGGLINKRTGHHIPVDFTALEQNGLTEKRIKAIAAGCTSRQKLRRLGHDGPAK